MRSDMLVKRNRLIIDTNLWISYLLGLDLNNLTDSIRHRVVILLSSKELLFEFIQVAARPKLSRYFQERELVELIDFLKYFSELIQVTSQVVICRDPKDNFLLALALDGKASHLLTGDHDLLSIHRFGQTSILTIREYMGGKMKDER